MQSPGAVLRVVARAALNAVGGGVAGDLAVDVLPAVASDLVAWLRAKSPEERRAALAALARATPAEAKAAADAVAAGQPEDVRRELELYLSLVPSAVRRSLRRPADPDGRSLPDLVPLDSDGDVASFLPAHLPQFRPGDRPLSGIDWELEELLGVGGFGEVWKARNPHFDAVPPVALKFCLDPAAKDRLLRHEAAVLNRVMRYGRHPGIVALQHTYLSADPPCLEYEYVAGGDLTGLLAEWRHLPPGRERLARANAVVRELACIVGFAHRLSPAIVHRDLKPANVLVEPVRNEGAETSLPVRLRVADFGIGGLAAGHAIARTGRGESSAGFLVTALRGAHTPLYASPQQMRGLPPDPRDDVHALGVIWFQVLTGNLTSGRPGGSRWTQRLADQGASRELIELLGSCVEEEADDRPADAAELAERMERLAGLAKAVAVPAVPTAAKPPAELPPKLTHPLGMPFVLVRPGAFRMGSDGAESQPDERPVRRATIERPFYLGVYPVTQEEFQAVMGRNPSQFTRGEGGGPRHPVEQVTWHDAVAFCRRLSEHPAERAAGRRYELPTEAEWEYACRAGTATAFSFGEALGPGRANFDTERPFRSDETCPALGRTSPVGTYPPNGWGLFDMHGNVWEWCADDYDDPFPSVSGLVRSVIGTQKVLRGGSWNNSGHLCRSARRNKHAPDFRSDTIGFRVAVRLS
jgi:formylglycine-generating enzyme required for sulfatase activity